MLYAYHQPHSADKIRLDSQATRHEYVPDEREPRFYASVAYNGCTWYYLSQTESKPADVNQQVWYYFGSSDGYRNDGFYLRTGIGIKKFVHPNDYPGNYVAKAETAIRDADILCFMLKH